MSNRPRYSVLPVIRWATAMGVLSGVPGWAQQAAPAPSGLQAMSFAELARITVTTVSKREERLFTAPAAVFVLGGAEAARTGAKTVAEALRVVPGLNVAQINGSTWGIGARGFQTQFAVKMLVMIDGRSVYNPVTGGVFWDIQDYPLAELDRVEVVLGPGGAIWGANAVNGVINILTRPAQETLGDRVSFGWGEGGYGAEMRHGWQVDQQTAARVYAKFQSDEGTRLRSRDTTSDDGSHQGRAGFRFDHVPAKAGRSWTISGEAYAGRNDLDVSVPDLLRPPAYVRIDDTGERVSGGHFLTRWVAPTGPDGTLQLAFNADTDRRDGPVLGFRTVKLQADLQHSLSVGLRHAIDWGLSARYSDIKLLDRVFAFSTKRYRPALFSGWLQDKIALPEQDLELTAGLKLEHNEFSGMESQPSFKLAWQPASNHTLWGGWSRAVRTRTLAEDSAVVNATIFAPGLRHPFLPTGIRAIGNPSLKPEKLDAIDAGWRWAPNAEWNVSLSIFHNRYSDLAKVSSGTPFLETAMIPLLVVPLPYDNGLSARATGGEFTVTWQPPRRWRMSMGLAHTKVGTRASTSDPGNAARAESAVPSWSAFVTGTVQLAAQWDLSAQIRCVDEISSMQIQRYTEGSLYLAWRSQSDWELALIGRNLFSAQHAELDPTYLVPRADVPRQVELRVSWQR